MKKLQPLFLVRKWISVEVLVRLHEKQGERDGTVILKEDWYEHIYKGRKHLPNTFTTKLALTWQKLHTHPSKD